MKVAVLLLGHIISVIVRIGPGGTGAIYRVDDAGNVTTFATLDGGCGRASHLSFWRIQTYEADWDLDANSFDVVGKRGLGDVEISEDGHNSLGCQS